MRRARFLPTATSWPRTSMTTGPPGSTDRHSTRSPVASPSLRARALSSTPGRYLMTPLSPFRSFSRVIRGLVPSACP